MRSRVAPSVGDGQESCRLADMADKQISEEEARRYARTTVLWTGTLLCQELRFECVIVNISAGGALLRVEGASSCTSPVKIDNPRLGELSGQIVWRKENELGIAFSDEPETVAAAIGKALG